MKPKIKGLLKNAVKFVARVADNAVLGGAVTNVIEENQGAKKGRIDWGRLSGQLIPVILVIAFITGAIDEEKLRSVLEIVSNYLSW